MEGLVGQINRERTRRLAPIAVEEIRALVAERSITSLQQSVKEFPPHYPLHGGGHGVV